MMIGTRWMRELVAFDCVKVDRGVVGLGVGWVH